MPRDYKKENGDRYVVMGMMLGYMIRGWVGHRK